MVEEFPLFTYITLTIKMKRVPLPLRPKSWTNNKERDKKKGQIFSLWELELSNQKLSCPICPRNSPTNSQGRRGGTKDDHLARRKIFFKKKREKK